MFSFFNHTIVEDDDFPIIPEEHKELVRERIKMAKEHPEMLLDWDVAIKMLRSEPPATNDSAAK